MDLVWLLFSARGRLAPVHFWFGALILFVFGLAVQLVPVAGQIAWLLSTYCWVCLYAKRLHDFGKSVWFEVWVFGFGYLCAAIGLVVAGSGAIEALTTGRYNWAMFAGSAGTILGLILASGAAHLIFLLYVGFRPSQKRANRYGPVPERRFLSPSA